MRTRPLASLVLIALVTALLAGCGGGGSGGETRPAPPAKEFPEAQGKTIPELLHSSGATPSELVVAPASEVFDKGEERYPFGVFTAGQEQVDDVEVALYFAKDSQAPVTGPLPAKLETLATKPAYRAQNGADPDEATNVYVVPKVDFPADGSYLAVAMIKGKGGKLEATRLPSPWSANSPRCRKSANGRRRSPR